jgi:CRP-like cAMP-binding protein
MATALPPDVVRASSIVAGHLESSWHKHFNMRRHSTFVCQEGEEDAGALVRTGLVWLHTSGAGGSQQVVALKFPGELVFPHELATGYAIQAIAPSAVTVLSSSVFEKLAASAEAGQLFNRVLKRNCLIAYAWISRAREDGGSRVAHLLCEAIARSGTEGSKFVLPFTQDQIAAVTGLTNVSVSRHLSRLEANGVLERKGREYTFDWFELQREAGFHPAYLA